MCSVEQKAKSPLRVLEIVKKPSLLWDGAISEPETGNMFMWNPFRLLQLKTNSLKIQLFNKSALRHS